jgi:hypothetical protein
VVKAESTERIVTKTLLTTTLTMGIEEAIFLITVLRKVGGCPQHSPRKIADQMLTALRHVGVPEGSLQTSVTSNITFKDYNDHG